MRPHEVLGIPANADATEIRRAFRTLAQKHHPDHGGDRSTFVQLHQAYEAMLRGETWDMAGSEPAPEPSFRQGAGSRAESGFTDDDLRDLFRKVEEMLAEQFEDPSQRREATEGTVELFVSLLITLAAGFASALCIVTQQKNWSTLLLTQVTIGFSIGLALVGALIMTMVSPSDVGGGTRYYRRTIFILTGITLFSRFLFLAPHER